MEEFGERQCLFECRRTEHHRFSEDTSITIGNLQLPRGSESDSLLAPWPVNLPARSGVAQFVDIIVFSVLSGDGASDRAARTCQRRTSRGKGQGAQVMRRDDRKTVHRHPDAVAYLEVWRRREDSIAAEARLDGVHPIRTGLDEETIGPEAAVEA